MSNEKIEIKLGGNVFKGEQKQNFFGNHYAGKNQKGVFEKKKGWKELGQEAAFNSMPKFSINFDFPITISGEFIKGMAIAEMKLGGAFGAYQGVTFSDLPLGEFKLKIDQSGLCAALKIDPFKSEPIKINTPLFELAKTWDPAKVLINALKKQGYDSDKLEVSEIQFKGPTAQIGGQFGETMGGAIGASLAGISVKLSYLGENDTLSLTCGLSAGVNVASGMGDITAKNGKQGTQIVNKVAIGVWEIEAAYQPRAEKNNTNSIHNQNHFVIDALYGEGSMMNEKNALSVLELYKNNQKQGADTAQKAFNRKRQQNDKTLLAIQSEDNAEKEKTQDLVLHINGLYEEVKHLQSELLEQKNKQTQLEIQANVLANFQGVMDGFGVLAQLGAMTGNKSIQTFGTVGMAVTQGVLGVAQLTGSFGLAAVTGAAMITPVGAVIGGILTIASLLMKSKEDGMQKAMQAISKQIGQLHKDMMEGFGIVINNQKITLDLIKQGFERIDNTLYQVVMNQSIMREEWSVIDEKLNEIQATLQEHDIKRDKDNFNKINRKLDFIIMSPKTDSKEEALIKMLILIKTQLKFSFDPLCTALKNQGNQLPGWFQVLKLKTLCDKREFINFDFDMSYVVNAIWWQEVVSYYFQMLPLAGGMNQDMQHYSNEIAELIQKTAESTALFLEKASSGEFLKRFLNHYGDKLEEIKQSADALLSHLNLASKQSRENYFNQVLALNAGVGDLSSIKISALESSKITLSDSMPAISRIQEKVKEYNVCLEEFKNYAGILFTIYSIDGGIQTKIRMLQPINSHYYTYRSLEGTYNEMPFVYLEGACDNQFNTLKFSSIEIEELQTKVKKNTSSLIQQMEFIAMLTKMVCLFSNSTSPSAVADKGSFLESNEVPKIPNKEKIKHTNHGAMFNGDTEWYTDDEINTLLQIKLQKYSKVDLFTTTYGINTANGNLFLDRLNANKTDRDTYKQENTRVVIPVCLGHTHWVLVLIQYEKNTSKMNEVLYVDPLGNSIHADVKNALIGGGFCKIEYNKQSKVTLQTDGWNCGPWIVFIAQYLIAQEEATHQAGFTFNFHDALDKLRGSPIHSIRQEQQNLLGVNSAEVNSSKPSVLQSSLGFLSSNRAEPNEDSSMNQGKGMGL